MPPSHTLLATTTPGLEAVALQELAELTGQQGWVEHPGLVGLPGDEETVCVLNLFAQSLYRVYLLLYRGTLTTLEALYAQLVALRVADLLAPEQPLAVRATRQGEHPFTSQDLARVAGQALLESYQRQRGRRPPVNLDAPEVIFRLEARDDRFWFALDTTGLTSLAERPYRRFAHPAALKPPIAYALVRLAGWHAEETLLDPMCGSGTILIEAARYACRLPNLRPFAFQRFPWHNPACWQAALARYPARHLPLRLLGYEISPRFLAGARDNAAAAGVALQLLQADATTACLAADRLVVNVPYGIRMGSTRKVARLYQAFGRNLARWPWTTLVAMTARPKLLQQHLPGVVQHDLEVRHGGLYTHVLVFGRGDT
ncbi:MAG: tRNA (guanine-N2)-dimethyltransferase [Candidatus Tectimicrobiota bacterium]|nr:MAG: tRNA (guanine-N2)-dimethyltransferase [Candidatus Tectomicrobia bacterium]